MRCQERRGFRIGRLKHVVGVRAIDCLKCHVRSSEKFPRALHRHDRISKAWRRQLVRDRKHLALLLSHSREQCRQVIPTLDLGEVGCLKRQRADFGERVGRRRRSRCFGLGRGCKCGLDGDGRRDCGGRKQDGTDHISPTESKAAHARDGGVRWRRRPRRAWHPHNVQALSGQRH